MKKIITWILLAAMLLGMFAGCEKSEDPTQPSTAPVETTEAPVGENNAAEVTAYLQAIYKDSGAETAGNFERFGIVRIAGVPYEVVWTADVGEDLVKIIVNDDGTVTIDVNEKCPEDTVYVLTATVTDANGNTSTASWEYLLPGAASLEEMHAIIDQAYALEKGEAMAEEVVLSGIIKSIDTPWSEQYQNITVTIQVEGREDKPIMCYRLKGEGAKDLNPGDTITVQGLIKNYNGTIEFDAGCQLVTVEKTGTPVEIPTDPHEILNDVYALGDNESLPYGPVTLTGRICAIDEEYSEQYGNITVTILIDWYTIKCYRMSGEGVEDLEMNDIITVQGYIKKYNGTREFDKPTLLDVVKVGEVPQPADQLQVAKVAYALDPGWTVPYGDVTLTGTITKVNYAWSDTYENITVTMVVDGDEKGEYPIECYRMTVAEDASKELKAAIKELAKGDKITVKGILMKYQSTSSGNTKVEFNVPDLIAVTKAPADTGSYTKITSASELVSTKYVMVVSTGYAPIVLDGSWISTAQPVVEGNKVTDSKGGVWTLSVDGDKVKITDSTGASIKPKGGNTNGITSGDYQWAWTCNSDGTFTFAGVGSDTVKLASNNSTDDGGFHRFRAYKNTTVSSNSYPCNFTLYKLEGSEFDPGEDTPATPTGTPAALMTSLPADGDVIAIVNSGKAMTATASGKKLAGEDATITDSKLLVTDSVAQMTVSIDENGYYSFISGGKYLTSGSTGNSLSFAAAPSDYSLWTVESAGSGLWYIKNVNAKYSGKVQSLEYYSGFTTYGHGTSAAYKMALYLVAEAPVYAPSMSAAPVNGDTIAIVNSGKAMTATASGKKLAGEDATITDNKLVVTDSVAQMTVSIDENGYYSFISGGKYLTSGSTGNSLSFAAAPSDYSLWTVESAGSGLWYIKNVNAKYSGKVQSLEYYSGFTTYGHGTSAAYKMALYLIEAGSGSVTPDPEPTPVEATAAQAVAAEEGTLLTVKGVVTLLDGSNVYIQDATGGICVRMSSAPTDLAVGDTIIGTGSKTTFNGMPQLGSGTYEKSSGLTLSAKETTIGALTTADLGTYVTIKDVTVTEVYDKNGTYSAPNITVEDEAGNTIQIYKAVVGKTGDAWDIKVGNVLTVSGAVGCYNTTLQLRNTTASEIVVTSQGDSEEGGDDNTGSETPAEPTTVTVSIADYATASGWEDATRYTTLAMDENVSITLTNTGTYNNTGKFYKNGSNWRIYQNESPAITFTAANGKTIVSVKITYSVSKTGVLTLNGSNVSSGTSVDVNASSVVFGVGNTGTATNGQVRITAIEVVYQ